MLRLRRYRVFLILAVLTVLGLYKFRDSILDDGIQVTNGWKTHTEKKPNDISDRDASDLQVPIVNDVVHEEKKIDVKVPLAETPRPRVTPPPVEPRPKPVQEIPEPDRKAHTAVDLTPPGVPKPLPGGGPPPAQNVDDSPTKTTKTTVHWTPHAENYPIPSGKTRQLPTGTPKALPPVQKAKFAKESRDQKAEREGKLAAIRQEFLHAWEGYREKAWLHDEVKPVSGGVHDKFMGWGATLVDTLDTLWIMGLTKEFDEAIENGVEKIDFTTGTQSSIAVFETTIRYLGGLIGAYDVSGRQKKYQILLDKAVELADVLMDAFDTPNRMPVLGLNWHPDMASGKKQASANAVLAEVGSLAMEFTRLAQMTKEPKYYDAVDRITDLLFASQMDTRMPGMWPLYVDLTGCNKTFDESPTQTFAKGSPVSQNSLSEGQASTTDATKWIPLEKPEPFRFDVKTSDQKVVEGVANKASVGGLAPGKLGRIAGWGSKTGASEESLHEIGLDLDAQSSKPKSNPQTHVAGNRGRIQGWDDPGKADETILGKLKSKDMKRRQLDVDDDSAVSGRQFSQFGREDLVDDSCIDDAFISGHSQYGSDIFSLGGMSDSTYEYLPKQFLLLGGLEPKYKTMYERSYEAFSKYLLFRTMLPDESQVVLGSGAMSLSGLMTADKGTLDPEGSHLMCFVGGMYGLGAQIFKRPDDLEFAKGLTEGCVWAYNVTASGIMPEGYRTAPCPRLDDCPWNSTFYEQIVDPFWHTREGRYDEDVKRYNEQVEEAKAAATAAVRLAQEEADDPATPEPLPAPKPLNRRQLLDDASGLQVAAELEEEEEPSDPIEREFRARTKWLIKPTKPPTHAAYMQSQHEEYGLPKGMVTVNGKNYILRPEAIESVFYMYRITGDKYWRDVGWNMFQSIIKATHVKFGHSAIEDVTVSKPPQSDSMESFWLAETLKYFYLLYADETLISLDEWVLNTEAHPFQRPTKPF